MEWIAEIWKWWSSNLFLWFIILWWFTGLVFLVSAFARWWVWRRLWTANPVDAPSRPSWFHIVALAVTASWWGDWKRLASRFVDKGQEGQFVLATTTAHVLPVYVLLIIFALGKEYLLVYLISTALFIPMLVVAGSALLSFPGDTQNATAAMPTTPPLWLALIREFLGVAPRFLYGTAAAAILAAIAIHAEWTFPVEITGPGLMSQLLNALFGVVVAVGAWMPPVGVFILGVPMWRGGFALAGLIAFFLVIPAAPQALIVYAQWVGRGQATRFASLIIVAAIAAALLTTLIVRALGLPLPYVYAPEQLL